MKDLLPEEIDGHRNAQGQTAREVVTQRKRLHREDPAHFTIVAKFYAEVRRAFKRQPASAQLLQPRDDDGDVTPMLLSAMVAFKKTGNRSPFAGCLRLLDEISRADLIGVLRWALELRPTVSAEQLRCALAVARFIARLELPTRWPQEVGAVSQWLDELMLHLWSSSKGPMQRPSTFIHQHRDVIFLVLPMEATQQILMHKGHFCGVERQLLQASQSRLGMALFGACLHGVLGERVQFCIEQGIVALLGEGTITAASMQLAQNRVLKDLMGFSFTTMLQEKRSVRFCYRGRPFHLTVKSLAEEVELSFACWLKDWASACRLIPALCCEAELGLERTSPREKLDLAEDIVQPWQDARVAANAALASTKDASSILDHLSKREHSYTVIDNTFRLEVGFLKAMQGAAGEEALKARILDILAGPLNKTTTVKTAATELLALQKHRPLQLLCAGCAGAGEDRERVHAGAALWPQARLRDERVRIPDIGESAAAVLLPADAQRGAQDWAGRGEPAL